MWVPSVELSQLQVMFKFPRPKPNLRQTLCYLKTNGRSRTLQAHLRHKKLYFILKHCVVSENIHTPPTDGQWKFLGVGGLKDRNFQGVWGCQREQFSRVIHKRCEIILICSAKKFETDALSKKKFKMLVSNTFFFAGISRSSFGRSIIHFTFARSAREINQDGQP